MRARPPYPALLVALAAVLAVLPALGGAEGAAGRTTLTLGVDQEVVGLDPTKVTAFSSFRRLDLLYNRLVTYDAGLHIVGDLAESWTTPDARTYVFHLRKGVRFHDGAEMTSEDVVYTIQRILDPKTASPGRSYLDAVDSVTAPDRYTVRFHLKYPLASLLSGLAPGTPPSWRRPQSSSSGTSRRPRPGRAPSCWPSGSPTTSCARCATPTTPSGGPPGWTRWCAGSSPSRRRCWPACGPGAWTWPPSPTGASSSRRWPTGRSRCSRRPA